MIKVGALWKNKNEAGQTFLAGQISDSVSIMILPNKFKNAENQPDFHLYIDEKKQKPKDKPVPKPIPQDDGF